MVAIDGPAERHASARPWTDVLHDWVATVDHKKLGLMYIGSGLVFFLQSPGWRYQPN